MSERGRRDKDDFIRSGDDWGMMVAGAAIVLGLIAIIHLIVSAVF